jgi:nitrite reductase/ring-hydroxylating ferredoxin subunit
MPMIPLLSHFQQSNAWITRYAETQLRRVRGDREYFETEPAELSAGTIIPDQWYAVLASNSLGDKPLGIRRLGHSLVVWRTPNGGLSCALDRCPHRGSKLSRGTVDASALVCPYHGFRFSAAGTCTLIPANPPGRRMPAGLALTTWPVHEEHGLIWIWWGEARDSYPEVPWFPQSEAEEHNSASKSSVWDFHYSRVIENSLDAHHFPFIHGSINPSCGQIVAPFSADDDGEVIRVTAGLKQDADDLDEDAITFHMDFRFPNVMHVLLTSRIHLIQVATPIDDDRTWMYVRYYQGYVRLPVVGPIASQALLEFDWKVAQQMQDIPIFQTQQPKVPGLDSGYRLIEADKGIALYLRGRDRLIAAAGLPPTLSEAVPAAARNGA